MGVEGGAAARLQSIWPHRFPNIFAKHGSAFNPVHLSTRYKRAANPNTSATVAARMPSGWMVQHDIQLLSRCS